MKHFTLFPLWLNRWRFLKQPHTQEVYCHLKVDAHYRYVSEAGSGLHMEWSIWLRLPSKCYSAYMILYFETKRMYEWLMWILLL